MREWRRGDYVSTDPARLDPSNPLPREWHWGKGLPFEAMRPSIEHSLPFGLYFGGAGRLRARAVTDSPAYVATFVLPAHRGRGLEVALERCSRTPVGGCGAEPATARAHGLYRRLRDRGPNTLDRVDPDPYRHGSVATRR
jgi:hypothetical protein